MVAACTRKHRVREQSETCYRALSISEPTPLLISHRYKLLYAGYRQNATAPALDRINTFMRSWKDLPQLHDRALLMLYECLANCLFSSS